jgi:enamine deaminase RidA (YjgF/YER057c/UK114 family)
VPRLKKVLETAVQEGGILHVRKSGSAGREHILAGSAQRQISSKRIVVAPRAVPPPPPGRYSHVCIVEAKRLMVISGQISMDRNGEVIGKGDFKRQFRQVYRYLGAILKEFGATWSDIVAFRTYLVDARDLPLFHKLRAELYKKIYPDGDYPANTLVVVDRLVHEDLMLEVEALVALD